ncbi:DUF6049 family protein [Myceligenerans cantabricum]
MTQQHGAPRRPTRITAGILTACLTLLGAPLPLSTASADDVGASPVSTSPTTGSRGTSPATTTAVAAKNGETDPVSVDLQKISPTVAQAGDQVKVAVRVTNNTDAALTGLEARLAVNAVALTQRSVLSQWESLALGDRVGGSGPGPKNLGTLQPGDSKSVQLTFPTATYTLQGWGPRELSVEVGDATGRRGVLRTFLMYDDGVATAQNPMRLTVAAPVTSGIVDPADLEGAQLRLAQDAAEEGRLDEMLRVARTGMVSLAVDPNVLGLAGSAGDEDLRAWGEEFLSATEGTSTYELPAWDPDIAALAHADISRGRMRGFLDTPVVDEWATPKWWGKNLAWPARGVADRTTVAAGTYADRPNMILGGGTFAPTSLDVANARADVQLQDGTARTAVADSVLSDVFTGATDVVEAYDAAAAAAADSGESGESGTDASASPADPAPAGAAGAQRILAETAALVAQNPEAPPHALIATDRGWYPDADAVDTVLAALDAASWVDLAPLDRLLEADAPAVERTPLEDDKVTKRELDVHEVGRIDWIRTKIIDFSSIADDPAELRRNSLRHLVAPLSVAYRTDAEQRQTAVEDGIAYTRKLLDAVTVIPREEINLISDRGDLPVRVRNGLDTAVTVTVLLRPDSPRLTVSGPVSGTVPSGKEMDLPIPVEAIGSGDVTVTSQLLAPSGVQLGSESSFEVRVRAGWEEVGTWIAAGLVGLLFLAGIWRTVRRGRSPNRATVEDVEAATGEIEAATESTADLVPSPADATQRTD